MVLVRNGGSGSRIGSGRQISKNPQAIYKNSAYNQQSGPISHIVWTDLILIFISAMVLNFKNLKKIL